MHKLQQNETQNEIEKIRREINLWHDKLERSKKKTEFIGKKSEAIDWLERSKKKTEFIGKKSEAID